MNTFIKTKQNVFVFYIFTHVHIYILVSIGSNEAVLMLMKYIKETIHYPHPSHLLPPTFFVLNKNYFLLGAGSPPLDRLYLLSFKMDVILYK